MGIGKLFYFLLIIFQGPLLGKDLQFDFEWGTVQDEHRKFIKASMLIPIYPRDSSASTYFFQFDTGASHSIFYSQRISLKEFQNIIQGQLFENMEFTENTKMRKTTDKRLIIGTLGADFLKGRIVRIDYPQQKIIVAPKYDSDDFKLYDMETLNGRPVITLTIRGKDERVLYDTGASLFGIWTSRRNWKKIRDVSNKTYSFPIRSWGNHNDGHFSIVSDVFKPPELHFTQELPVWYVDHRNFRRFFKRNDLYGILGNQPLLKKQIIIDMKNGLFGIERAPY